MGQAAVGEELIEKRSTFQFAVVQFLAGRSDRGPGHPRVRTRLQADRWEEPPARPRLGSLTVGAALLFHVRLARTRASTRFAEVLPKIEGSSAEESGR